MVQLNRISWANNNVVSKYFMLKHINIIIVIFGPIFVQAYSMFSCEKVTILFRCDFSNHIGFLGDRVVSFIRKPDQSIGTK